MAHFTVSWAPQELQRLQLWLYLDNCLLLGYCRPEGLRSVSNSIQHSLPLMAGSGWCLSLTPKTLPSTCRKRPAQHHWARAPQPTAPALYNDGLFPRGIVEGSLSCLARVLLV